MPEPQLPEPARPASIRGGALYFKMPERTLRRWVENGIIPSWRVGRQVLVDLDDIDRMRQAGAQGCQVSAPGTLALLPWSSPADGTPGWKILLPSRRVAGTIAAATGGEFQPAEGSYWPVIVRHPGLAVTLLDADEETFTCLLPLYGLRLAVRRRAWGALETLTSPDGLPADGLLTVRQFIVENPAGQLLQALVPVFTATAAVPREEAVA